MDSTGDVEFDRIWDPLVRGLRESLFRTAEMKLALNRRTQATKTGRCLPPNYLK